MLEMVCALVEIKAFWWIVWNLFCIKNRHSSEKQISCFLG